MTELVGLRRRKSRSLVRFSASLIFFSICFSANIYGKLNILYGEISDVNKDLRDNAKDYTYKDKVKDLNKLSLKAKDQSFKAKTKDIELT